MTPDPKLFTFISSYRDTLCYRVLCAFIAFSFTFSLVLPPGYAQVGTGLKPVPTLLNLPAPGMMVTTSAAFTPALINGITIHPENPLEFDFIVGTGDQKLEGKAFEDESTRLIKYFLASLTVPEDQMWVNLSPYEKDRIIPNGFGTTEMGRDLLAQDYILKQLTASLMYPEKELGSEFWKKIYQKAYEQYGTTEIPMNTFNKVWIVPEKAVVYEHGNSAFVVKSHLKVMLEADYVAANSNVGTGLKPVPTDDNTSVSTEIIREVILPELEKEVNEGKTFTNLRQIYNSVILAAWFKKNLKETLLGQVYVDKTKTKGVDVEDKTVNQKIYEQYLEAFKKGVYNYIKEDVDPVTKEVIPRKYFSGGTTMTVGNLLETFNATNKLPANREYQEIVGEFLARQEKYNGGILNVNLVELSESMPVAQAQEVIEKAKVVYEAELTARAAKSIKEAEKMINAGFDKMEVAASASSPVRSDGGLWKRLTKPFRKAEKAPSLQDRLVSVIAEQSGREPEEILATSRLADLFPKEEDEIEFVLAIEAEFIGEFPASFYQTGIGGFYDIQSTDLTRQAETVEQLLNILELEQSMEKGSASSPVMARERFTAFLSTDEGRRFRVTVENALGGPAGFEKAQDIAVQVLEEYPQTDLSPASDEFFFFADTVVIRAQKEQERANVPSPVASPQESDAEISRYIKGLSEHLDLPAPSDHEQQVILGYLDTFLKRFNKLDGTAKQQLIPLLETARGKTYAPELSRYITEHAERLLDQIRVSSQTSSPVLTPVEYASRIADVLRVSPDSVMVPIKALLSENLEKIQSDIREFIAGTGVDSEELAGIVRKGIKEFQAQGTGDELRQPIQDLLTASRVRSEFVSAGGIILQIKSAMFRIIDSAEGHKAIAAALVSRFQLKEQDVLRALSNVKFSSSATASSPIQEIKSDTPAKDMARVLEMIKAASATKLFWGDGEMTYKDVELAGTLKYTQRSGNGYSVEFAGATLIDKYGYLPNQTVHLISGKPSIYFSVGLLRADTIYLGIYGTTDVLRMRERTGRGKEGPVFILSRMSRKDFEAEMAASSPVGDLDGFPRFVETELDRIQADPVIKGSVAVLAATVSKRKYFSEDDLQYTLKLFKETLERLSHSARQNSQDVLTLAQTISREDIGKFMPEHHRTVESFLVALGLSEQREKITVENLEAIQKLFTDLVNAYLRVESGRTATVAGDYPSSSSPAIVTQKTRTILLKAIDGFREFLKSYEEPIAEYPQDNFIKKLVELKNSVDFVLRATGSDRIPGFSHPENIGLFLDSTLMLHIKSLLDLLAPEKSITVLTVSEQIRLKQRLEEMLTQASAFSGLASRTMKTSSPVSREEVRREVFKMTKQLLEIDVTEDSDFSEYAGTENISELFEAIQKRFSVPFSREQEDQAWTVGAIIDYVYSEQKVASSQTSREGSSSSPVTESRQTSVVSRQPMTNPGGIDLNPALLDLQIKRDGNGVPLPLPLQPIHDMHIEGFLPVIINVTPITNLPLLLGLDLPSQEEKPAQLTYQELSLAVTSGKERFCTREQEEIFA